HPHADVKGTRATPRRADARAQRQSLGQVAGAGPGARPLRTSSLELDRVAHRPLWDAANPATAGEPSATLRFGAARKGCMTWNSPSISRGSCPLGTRVVFGS